MVNDRRLSSAIVAAELGVTRSAVSNWCKRKNLPAELQPEKVIIPGGSRPEWRESQLPGLRAWLAGHTKASRTITAAVAPRDLRPHDIVISVAWQDTESGSEVLVTVRRLPERA